MHCPQSIAPGHNHGRGRHWSCGFSGDGGDAKSAQLYNPTGLAVDAQGNLFIADSGNQRVRKVDINGIITTVAGVGQNCSYTEGDVLATSACLGGISNVRVDASGNLFIAGTSRDEILEVLTNGMMTTLGSRSVTASVTPVTENSQETLFFRLLRVCLSILRGTFISLTTAMAPCGRWCLKPPDLYCR